MNKKLNQCLAIAHKRKLDHPAIKPFTAHLGLHCVANGNGGGNARERNGFAECGRERSASDFTIAVRRLHRLMTPQNACAERHEADELLRGGCGF